MSAAGTGDNGISPGSIAHFPTSTAPSGWLKANGALVSRTAYAALFGVIGTTFGAGDGSTTFQLPDLRGEFVRGLDDTRGVDSGRTLGSAQAADMAPHAHTMRSYDGITSLVVFSGAGTNLTPSTSSTNGTTPLTTANAGGTETRPRNVALLACIKY